MTTERRIQPPLQPQAPESKPSVDRTVPTASGWKSVGRSAQLYAAVGLGAIVGGTARWLASELLHDWLGSGFPWGTLFANVTGSFLIGFYAALSASEGRLFAGPVQRQFVMSGICGGYTTFSIFSLETIRFLQAENFQVAGASVGVSLAGWLLAVWAGFALATRINRLGRSRNENS